MQRNNPVTEDTRLHLVLFEPDIPQNTGAMLRLAACLNLAVDVIEPCGFVFGEKRMRRAGLDYMDQLRLERHDSWDAYKDARRAGRLIVLTTKGDTAYTDFAFEPGDALLMGRESAGLPDHVHAAADARLVIPLAVGMRSLNVAQAAAMAVGEALRQLDGFPEPGSNSITAPDLETAS